MPGEAGSTITPTRDPFGPEPRQEFGADESLFTIASR